MSRRCDLLGVGVMSGHNISHSNRKTKRKFLPNLKNVALKSDVLGVDLNFKIAVSTLRTVMNKYGNVDSFLVNYRFSKLTDLAKGYRSQIKKKLIKSGKLSEVKIVNEKETHKKQSLRKVKLAQKAAA